MKYAVVLMVIGLSVSAVAAEHGPVFGLATPTNSQGEWSFDEGVFGRNTSLGSQASFRELIAYGFTPHLTLSFTLPVAIGNTTLSPTRIQPGDDFDTTVSWRFQHRATKVGTRFESTAFAGLAVPGPQSGFAGVHTTNVPGTMFGVVTGMASLSNYVWLGSTYTKFYEHNGDKWDWRLFGELVGERSDRFLQANVAVPETQAHQVFLGPTALGIFHNYTVSFGAQFPVYQNVGSAFPKEHVRFALNFSYLLFQHGH
jgi:hypothetical protein